MIPKEQEDQLKEAAKMAVERKNITTHNLNELIKAAQKLGYLINPKTGELTQTKWKQKHHR